MTDNGRPRMDLERHLRSAFERHAGEAVTSVRVADRVRPAARRRRAARIALGAACVASAIVVTGAVVDGTNLLDGSGPAAGPSGGSGTVSGWRTEHWRDMQVDVPADWGFGGAPMPMRQDGTEADEALACGATAMVSAGGEKLEREDPTMPYVGRPIALTDVCDVYPWIGPNAAPPRAPYVWLGAAVEPGVVDLGDGYVQETVAVNGSTLTVATQDAGLRRQILDSARGGETCMSELEEDVPLPGSMDPTAGSGAGMTVCAYRRAGDGGPIRLVYATRLGGRAHDDYLAAVASAPPPEHCSTPHGSEAEWVVLEIRGEDTMQHVVHLSCPGIDTTATALNTARTVGLTPELVRPWAVQGIPAVLYGPTGGRGAMIDSFIGPQG